MYLMSNLTLLHESVVDDSQIDSLGHMNVRYYVSRAAEANFKLLKDIGIAEAEGFTLRRVDTYNRFLKEQFAGAKLAVYGGLVGNQGDKRITGYYEIRNVDTNDLAATFIITSSLINRESEVVVPLQNFDPANMLPYKTEVPPEGQPRTLDLTPPRQVSFNEIAALIPEDTNPNGMSGRREGIVIEEDCDENGRLKEALDPMFVMFRPQPGEELKNMGPPVQRDEHGRRYSFAMMEIRSVNWHRPGLGDTIVSLSADVNYGEKWRHMRRWMFEKSSGLLLGITDHAAVCMDLDARRAIPIPKVVREEMARIVIPDQLVDVPMKAAGS